MMLAGAAREEKGSVAGQGQVRLLGDCRGGIREFVNDADRPAFLERELMGFDVDRYRWVRVHGLTRGPVAIYMF